VTGHQQNTGAPHTTLRQQLLRSHLKVAALAAFVLVFAAVAMQMLREPITTIRLDNVPSANAAMNIQIGLQKSEANLRGWVALKNPALRDNVGHAWNDEITPAIDSLLTLSENDTEERRQVLSSVRDKLNRLKKLQDWTIDVAAKPGNEPARLVFTQEFGPTRKKLVNSLDEFRYDQNQLSGEELDSFFQLRLAISEAEAALGRFVVEGIEADASNYHYHVERVRTIGLTLTLGTETPLPIQIVEQLDVLERLSDSIIASKRSPRSNVAWHTISTRVAPLSADIADELAKIADHEVSAVRNRVEQIATWIHILSICSIIALFVVLVIALVLSSRQAKHISAPVTKLFQATRAMKDGDFSTTLTPEGVHEVRGLIGSFNAMRESISESHQALEEIAFTDELTGLANRKAFNDTLAAINADSDTDTGFTGVIVIDLDYFKQVNDSLGHDAGDRLLSVFGNRLKQSLGSQDFVARVGGDEFIVLAKSLANIEDAEPVVENIRQATSQPITYHSEKIMPSATIGVAVESSQNLDAIELVKKADLALYEAKENGRGGFCFYSEKLHKQVTIVRRLTELVELNAPEDMFQMVYQPYVELATGRIIGVEALLRCIHPECAAIPTIDIITMLERNGHISGVSQWVMQEALDQLTEWHNTYHLPDDFTMSVNVSAALLPDTSFVQAILDIVEKSAVSGSSLTIELTETTVMEDYTRCKDAMSQLNAVGIEFAMDDFGTGYSSLVRLKEMPLSLLKVDQTFVTSMLSSANDAAIVDASVRLGHAIGMSVTAEGIETAEHAEALRKLGCNRGQGYYFSRPKAPADLNLDATLRSHAA